MPFNLQVTKLFTLFLFVALVLGCDNDHVSTKATRMLGISIPEGFALRSLDCVRYWKAVNMAAHSFDKIGEDWNDQLHDNYHSLIKEECFVKEDSEQRLARRLLMLENRMPKLIEQLRLLEIAHDELGSSFDNALYFFGSYLSNRLWGRESEELVKRERIQEASRIILQNIIVLDGYSEDMAEQPQFVNFLYKDLLIASSSSDIRDSSINRLKGKLSSLKVEIQRLKDGLSLYSRAGFNGAYKRMQDLTLNVKYWPR